MPGPAILQTLNVLGFERFTKITSVSFADVADSTTVTSTNPAPGAGINTSAPVELTPTICPSTKRLNLSSGSTSTDSR
ncbi:MAG: hypothetical protein AB7Q37_19080 [Pyrinomonadaceae bacterium]